MHFPSHFARPLFVSALLAGCAALVGYTAELAAADSEIDQRVRNRPGVRRAERIEEDLRRYGDVFQLDTTAPPFPINR